MELIRHPHTFATVHGYRYTSSAVAGSPEEAVLDGIQFDLVGDKIIGAAEPVPHLELVPRHGDEPVVTLWVPAEQQAQAEAMFAQAGFTVAPG